MREKALKIFTDRRETFYNLCKKARNPKKYWLDDEPFVRRCQDYEATLEGMLELMLSLDMINYGCFDSMTSQLREMFSPGSVANECEKGI